MKKSVPELGREEKREKTRFVVKALHKFLDQPEKLFFRLISGFGYPKIFGLIASIILAYFIFRNPSVSGFFSGLGSLSYLGVFIAGTLFSFGFSAPFAAGFFIVLNPQNTILTIIIGGIGAMVSDLLIFKFIRLSFMDEIKRLEKTKIAKEINHVIELGLGHKIKIYLMYALIGFLIASPLSDEAGIIMLSSLTKVKQSFVALLGFVLHAAGIWILLYL